jgi:phosphonatase-like hydrolase
MPIKLLVCDMAGTTLQDSHEVHQCLKDALAEERIIVSDEETRDIMGYPKPIAIQLLLEQKLDDQSRITDEYVDQIHDRFVEMMVNHYRTSPDVRELPEVSNTWQKLRERGIKIALDTGFSRPIADAIIERLNWRDKIDASVTSDEVAYGRPAPDMIFRAMNLLNIEDIQHVAKIGDTASDMEQGKNAGCPYVIGVTTGSFSREALQELPSTHVIDSFGEVLSVISR